MNKKSAMITGFRILAMVTLLALIYRNDKIETFFTAVTLTAICFWVFPYCLTQLIFIIFKIKEEYGGTLLFDDSDPTDCRFRMVFNFDPEDLIKEPTFLINTQRSDIRGNQITRDENTD